ncbi:MAG TPA: metallophosphoesterase [Blastocatellia bacterium]|nr:metallophosphoesterase [Blastocatellia bacterium]
MRIFAVSDLHTDFSKNWQALQQLPSLNDRSDTLIVAGDIADDLRVITKTLRLLRGRFDRVFFVPGNHELWVRNSDLDSIAKFHQVLALCDDLGVQTRPARVGDAWIVPLFSWYDPAYDADHTAVAAELEGWTDFYFCKWPPEITSISDFFLQLNEPNIRAYDGPVITVSHFLPHRDLLPPVSFLKFKGLPLVAGSEALDRQIRKLQARVHVFGHSHINYDRVIDGIRYVHNAFGYPKREGVSTFQFKTIWEAGPTEPTAWIDWAERARTAESDDSD